MILEYGDVSTLAGKHWYALELTSEKNTEATLKRIGKGLSTIFREKPCEIFIPVVRRDLEIFELATCNIVYVRGELKLLARMKTITGTTGLLTDGSGRADRSVPIEDYFVQKLILKCHANFMSAHADTVVGSFVRLIGGETRDFCGTVAEMTETTATVMVELFTKKIFVTTPLVNVLNLDYVPEDRRTFYWSEEVKLLEDATMLAEDLHWKESKVPQDNTPPVYEKHKFSRVRTVTVFIRNKIAEKLSPKEVAIATVKGLMDGTIQKRPKNLDIIFNAIKTEWHRAYPELKSWRKMKPKLSKKEMYQIGAGLDIPNVTPVDQIAQDGRSARKLKPRR